MPGAHRCIQWIETPAGSERHSNYGVKRFSSQVMRSVSITDVCVMPEVETENNLFAKLPK